ncbi:regulatory subunit 4 [Musa troglodytarum]|uniref:Regulatory subunit 4 n=5 Tax=Magnoliopsida TaxID=3398 RepID=A0A9E7FNE0_9LILI|nr:regulatory subunit 4 [Musa troglodytarum]
MGQGTPGGMGKQGLPGDRKRDGDKKDKKFEPAAPPSRVGRKQRRQKGPEAAARLPAVTPLSKCRLRLLKLERVKDYLLMEEEFVANQERLRPQEEKNEEDRSKVDDLRGSPMSVGNLEELIDENHAIVSSSVGPEYYVSILSFVDKDQLEPGCAILMHNKVLSVVGLLQDEVDPMVSVMKVEKAPLESYADIGGLDSQIQEIKEAVELPLTHPELYEDIGIRPPKGVILYGEPGTGKTLLAKAVANSTSATFLRVVGSELIQKYLGDGPKLVRELFRVADELSPSIVFIDEIDAVGTKRYDAHSGGEREIQRTMLELLNQLDGFDSRGDVKIHTSRMTLADDVNLEEFVMTKDEFSGADIKAICTESGLLALRERRMKVTHADFKKAKEKVMFKKKEGGTPGGMGKQGLPGDRKRDGDKKDKKFEPAAPPSRVGRKQRRQKGPEAAARLPAVTPLSKCRLRLLKLERVKDYLLMEEEFVANQERLRPQEEKNEEDRSKVDDLRGSPMSVGNLEELIDENHAIVSSSVGPEYYVSILSFVDKDQLEPGCAILMHNKVLSVVGLLQDEVDPMVSVMKVEKAPLESYADIGGLDSQIQEIKEAVELPLTHPELYEDIGIRPPKGVILYGEPGTGKTLLAKAVANSTSATFLRVVGSELIQKYLGDGPKLVRELFRVADELSPSIVFIDEIDAVGTKRYDAHSGGEREIQRTMLELLNQLDGFDSRGDVKVILATNRIESLDPALLRPGRIDRKIEFPLPDIKTRRRIFQIHTSRMTLADDVNLEEFVMTKDEFSGADIKAICTEAGLLALRERRMKVTHADFKKAKEKVMFKKKEGVPEGLYM